MKKITLVHAACLFACGASLSTAQAQQGVQDIPEIIVTASRSEQDLQTAPVGATIITRAQIESAGVVDANEAIRKIGGVAGKTDLNGGREYSLDLRGFGQTSDQNIVVLVDGIRISENEQAPARLSAVSASLIERIEILRGGASVMWGEGAIAGVINIITRKDGKAGLSGQVSTGAETYGGRDGTAVLRIGSQSGRASFDINARSNTSTGYRMNNQMTQDVVSMGVSAREGALAARTRIEYELSNNRWPGSLTLAEFQVNPRQSQTSKLNDYGALKQTRLSTGLEYNFGDWTAIVDMGIKSKSSLSSSSGGAATTTSTTVSQFSPRATYKAALGNTALTGHVGFDSSQWNYNNNGAYDTNFNQTTRTATQSNRAMFATTDWLFSTQTRVVLGYRAENAMKTSQDATTAPTLTMLANKLNAGEFSMNQSIQKGVDVYVRTAMSYRMANIDDYTNTSPTIPLRPQTSKDKELGIKLKQGVNHFTARYFLQNTVDEIYLDKSLNSGFGYNVNIAPTKRNGIELEGGVDVSSRVALSASVQNMKALFNGGANAGKHIPLVSEQVANARVTYRMDDKQTLETAYRFVGSSYVGDDVSNTCGNKTPAIRMLDGLYRWKNSAFDFSLGVTNMTNALSYAFAYKCSSGIYPDLGRTFRAAMKYNF